MNLLSALTSGGISELKNQVVVITGASSGIGRSTALAFAQAGARLALAARNLETLQEVAAECTGFGAEALVTALDVTDEIAMVGFAREVVDAYGRIDVWINNAGVGLFGPFTEADMEVHRRVVETNLIGSMNGAAAALPHFRERRRGVLITNISLGGFAPVPFAAAYTASKFGLRGFMAALRQELAEFPDIHVCGIFPSIIDTPGFQHGGNVSGVELRPASPVYDPEAVAAAMVKVAVSPRPEVSVGLPARAAKVGYGLMPATTEAIIGATFRRYVSNARPAPRQLGNLFHPSTAPLTRTGGWKQPAQRNAQRSTLAWAGFGGLAAAGVAFLLQSNFSPTRSRTEAQR